MITPKALAEKSDKLFFKIVSAVLKEENLFPLTIPSDKKIDDTGFNHLRDAIISIYANSKEAKGKGYTVEWKRKKIEGSTQDVPTKIYYETLADYLFFTKREKDFLKIQETYQLIAGAFPQNTAWTKEQPSFLLTHAAIMPDLLKVVRYFFDNTPPYDLYLRQLPIEELHTKFIEDNYKPLRQMLDRILPAEKIRFEEKDFSARYQVKRPNLYTQVRVLDDALKSTLGFRELALTLDDAALLNWQPDRVFIIENAACFRSFPNVKNSVAIFGEGFKSRISKRIPWLANCELYCWFDIDAAGFEMLNMVRQYYKHARSFLMDKASYSTFATFSVHAPYRKIELPLLNTDEEKMYHFLLKENRRLEQERITHAYLQNRLNALN